MREVGRAADLAHDLAEIVAGHEQVAHRPAAVGALDHDGLSIAPVDVDADADTYSREIRLAHLRVRPRREVLTRVELARSRDVGVGGHIGHVTAYVRDPAVDRSRHAARLAPGP